MNNLIIDIALVHRLVSTQFPQWREMPLHPVIRNGWDNKTFHLGDHMLVRMPSAAEYALQVEKEHTWLPRLAPLLPLSIPFPLAIGEPGYGYPWKWSIYRWIEGESAATIPITNLCDFAATLAQFLAALQHIDSTGGPTPGLHSFYRGGSLTTYDVEVRQSIVALKDKIDVDAVTEIWETALTTSWQNYPVWVHGDISVGNLLMQDGHLSAVIDFGQLAVGDPACDLSIAWTLFRDESRKKFRQMLSLDEGTWARGRAWTLWKALIIAADFVDSNAVEGERCWQIINEVVTEHKGGA